MSDLVDGRKRAALALLGLDAADRKWLLAQLPDAERVGVAALLAELGRMNLPASAQQIAQAADALVPQPADILAPQAAEAPVEESPSAAAMHALARASAAALHRVLHDEPDGVIARVCMLSDWRWSAELRGLLGDTRAGRIARLQRGLAAAPPVLAQALAAALAARVEAGAHEADFAAELQAAGDATPRRNGRPWSRWFR